MNIMNIARDELAKRQATIKVGTRVMATKSGKYGWSRGTVTDDAGNFWRVKFDDASLGEAEVAKGNTIPLNSARSTNTVVANAMAANAVVRNAVTKNSKDEFYRLPEWGRLSDNLKTALTKVKECAKIYKALIAKAEDDDDRRGVQNDADICQNILTELGQIGA